MSFAQRAQPVYVVNQPSTGTSIDTYTKIEIDERLSALQKSIDILTETLQGNTRSFMSIETKKWIDETFLGLRRKVDQIENNFKQLGADVAEFKDDVVALLQIPEEELSDYNPAKVAKTEETTATQVPTEEINPLEFEI